MKLIRIKPIKASASVLPAVYRDLPTTMAKATEEIFLPQRVPQYCPLGLTLPLFSSLP